MYRKAFSLVALASLGAVMGCSDRPVATAPEGPPAPPPPAAALGPPEGLARALALALGDPAFRTYVRAQLEVSPFREHKLAFRQFLAANGGRAATAIAQRARAAPAAVLRAAEAAIPLEIYLPVPAHRAAWNADERVLVATAIRDHDAPVAFDPRGGRHVLSADEPPAIPVLALVPVETDFRAAATLVRCLGCGGGGWGGGGGGGGHVAASPPSGLYMTQSHFNQSFEGWLKGQPEFEVHVLGQQGQTDSLTTYQCSGEHQRIPYYFDQNGLDWSGSALLFSETQLDSYHAAHPGQDVRVFVVEDDDTACQIKTDNDRFKLLAATVDGANQAQTAGKDTTLSTATKIWRYAKAVLQLITVVGSLLNTNDELVGNAVQDIVAGEYHAGFNWIVKGENNVTNGWIQLEMK
jgi:hypothetical protein